MLEPCERILTLVKLSYERLKSFCPVEQSWKACEYIRWVETRNTHKYSYLFNKLWFVNCLIPIYQPPDRIIPNNTQLLLKGHFAWFSPMTKLFHSVIDDILKGTAFYCKFKNTLYPNITWLEEASAICWNIVNLDLWVGVVYPMMELCWLMDWPTINLPNADLILILPVAFKIWYKDVLDIALHGG